MPRGYSRFSANTFVGRGKCCSLLSMPRGGKNDGRRRSRRITKVEKHEAWVTEKLQRERKFISGGAIGEEIFTRRAQHVASHCGEEWMWSNCAAPDMGKCSLFTCFGFPPKHFLSLRQSCLFSLILQLDETQRENLFSHSRLHRGPVSSVSDVECNSVRIDF